MTCQQQKYTQNCPVCGRQLRIKTKYIGMTLTCQHCHGNFVAMDSSSIWDSEMTPVDNVFSKLQKDLEKSGVLDKSGVLIRSVEMN
ncbi:MAG: hypothetical protein Q4C96_06010 [Planctomycetia bacterium]|nr:hypothetical protein [Planctomycetia bacterium]